MSKCLISTWVIQILNGNFIIYVYWLIICTSETFSFFLHIASCALNTLLPTIWKLKHSLFKKVWGHVINQLCKWALLILQLSATSATSQLILQPFRRFTYVTAHSPTLPLLHLRHSSFSNHSFSSPTSQAIHLRHLASRPWPIC